MCPSIDGTFNLIQASHHKWHDTLFWHNEQQIDTLKVFSIIDQSILLLAPNSPLGPRQTTADPVNLYTERLNGRMAMLGLAIGVTVEALTGRGIIDQVFGLFN